MEVYMGNRTQCNYKSVFVLHILTWSMILASSQTYWPTADIHLLHCAFLWRVLCFVFYFVFLTAHQTPSTALSSVPCISSDLVLLITLQGRCCYSPLLQMGFRSLSNYIKVIHSSQATEQRLDFSSTTKPLLDTPFSKIRDHYMLWILWITFKSPVLQN